MTAQAHEKLILDGQALSMACCPALPLDHPRLIRNAENHIHNTACWRGYIGTWEIRFIQVGRSLPIPLRQVTYGPQGPIVADTIEYHDIGSGFYVEPRLAGDRVILEISQQSASIPHRWRSGLPAAQVQRLATTVSGRLGEWIPLGGSGQQMGSDQRGTLNLSTRELRESRAIWLKVEEVR